MAKTIRSKATAAPKPSNATSPRLAKLTRPRSAGLLKRERLFQRLDHALSGCAILWVAAQPGAGKTSLISSYFEAHKLKGIWYQCDAGDHDLSSFFYYIGLALTRATPRKSPFSMPLTPEYLPNLPVFIRRYFRELAARLPQPFTIILDNYQDGATPALNSALDIVCDEMPEGSNLIVMSREEPPAELSRQIANQRARSFDVRELHFTLEETSAILREEYALGDQAIQAIQKLTDGWAAGIVLMREHARSSANIAAPVSKVPANVFNYFTGQILDKLPQETQELLLKTSLMPRFTAAIAQLISGNDGATQVLEHMHRHHLFTDRHDSEDSYFQYHPLFREFLLARARLVFPSDQWTELSARCAPLMETAGDIDAAAQLYLQAQAWPELIRVICVNAQALLMQGRNQTLETLIQSVPAKLTQKVPWLIFWQAIASMPFDPLGSRKSFADCYPMFQRADDLAGQFLVCAGVLHTLRLTWSEFISADPWIAELDQLIEAHPDMVSPEIEAQICSSATTIQFRDPSHRLIDYLKKRAWQILSRRSQPALSYQLGHFLVHLAIWRGDVTFGRRAIAEVERQGKGIALEPMNEVLWSVMKTVFYGIVVTEFDEAFRCLEHGIAVANKAGLVVLQPLIHGNGALAMLCMGDLVRAEATVAVMEQMAPRFQLMDVGFWHYLKACIELLRDNWSNAERHATESLSTSERCGTPVPIALNRVALGHALIGNKKYQEADEQFEWTLKFGHTIQSVIHKHDSLFGLADSALQQRKITEAATLLRSALNLGREQGYLTFHPWLPKTATRLLKFALDQGIELDYVRQFIRRRGLTPDDIVDTNWPWPIKLFTLGHFAIHLDDAPVTFGRKTPKKDLALLKLLVAAGRAGLSEATIKDELWSEMDGDRAANSFKQSLHRLRELVKENDAISTQDGIVMLNRQKVWTDAWAFESFCERAPKLDGDANVVQVYGQQLLELYAGNFLTDDADLPFAVSERERLRALFVENISKLARHFEQAEGNAEALELFRKAVRIDAHVEAFYQGMMRCHSKLNQVAEGLAVYERLRRVLLSQWKTEPSAASKKLFDTLHRAVPAD